ncbi:probable carboxylesterase 2 [Typha latifolia]|uniref:probable carboxylesterase 2 n=1 Tax=Typha latifolia TaxID=4733 RepID=UPI003C302A38
MDPDTQIQFEFIGVIRQYKSGRVERLAQADTVPPSLDPITGVDSKDVEIDPLTNVSARLYLPDSPRSPSSKLPILVYFHGGAFVVGSASERLDHNYLNLLASEANSVVVSVEYRRAPEHLLPAAYDDSWAALEWVAAQAKSGPESWLAQYGDLERVFLVGFSAGGNIAHNIAIRARGEIKVKGLVLIHAYFLASEKSANEPKNSELRDKLEEFWGFVSPQTSGLDDPRVNPATTLKLLGCERVMVCVADDELEERGRRYYEGLREIGWGEKVELLVSEGEKHEFFLENPGCEKAVEMMTRLVAFFGCH